MATRRKELSLSSKDSTLQIVSDGGPGRQFSTRWGVKVSGIIPFEQTEVKLLLSEKMNLNVESFIKENSIYNQNCCQAAIS